MDFRSNFWVYSGGVIVSNRHILQSSATAEKRKSKDLCPLLPVKSLSQSETMIIFVEQAVFTDGWVGCPIPPGVFGGYFKYKCFNFLV